MHLSDWSSDVCSSDLVTNEAPAAVVDDAAGSGTPLIGRRAGQARPADHVASRVDIAHLGAVMLVDIDLSATIDLDTNVFQAQLVSVAGTASSEERRVGNACVSTCRSRWSP